MLRSQPRAAWVLPLLAACGSGDSGGTDPDTQAPTVAITAPAPGTTVHGDVLVQASASDNDAVAGLQFRLDGNPLGPEDLTSPYAAEWSTTDASDELHTLTAVARDASGNIGTATAVEVTVSNLPPPAPGSITVAAATTGIGTDVDGYTIAIDGGHRGTIGANATISIAPVAAGERRVALSGIMSYCRLTTANPQLVTVPSGVAAMAVFNVECTAPPAGQVAYVGQSATSEPGIRIASSDGGSDQPLVADAEYFDWSPDGTRIAFVRHGPNFASTLHRIDADGTDEVFLADLPDGASGIRWGPDGVLAFSADREASGGARVPDVFLIDSDGSDLRPLAASVALRQTPVFSPDGDRIVVSMAGTGEEVTLWIYDSDGTNPEQLTSGFRDRVFDWSHDGARLLLTRQPLTFGATKVYVIGADGSNLQQLTTGDDYDFSPAWSPDDSWIVYAADQPTGRRIRFMRPDGSSDFTASWMSFGAFPRWQP